MAISAIDTGMAQHKINYFQHSNISHWLRLKMGRDTMPVYLNCNAVDGQPAARVGDTVSCPLHGETHITSGSPDTFFNGRQAARVGDGIACGDTIIQGSNSVFVNGKPAAHLGSPTAHGGKIVSGSPTVFIGNGAGQGSPLQSKNGLNYSLRLDFSAMLLAGNHNEVDFARKSIRITRSDGTYLTTITTDESGISTRFFTAEEEAATAWVIGADAWNVIEELEVVDEEDVFRKV